MDKKYGLGEFAKSLGCRAVYDEPMKCHTSFKTGGGADVFITADSAANLS
ncbi:MAG TPA: UDP-N-acetylenolpyruvoylglucosamine reductase, partial [Ruminococcaceae bacterium]|nr:UDP-N-acetylenolpyruvoylglucosamine reductase [Oscillospiraceae bacterium]